VRLKLSGLKGIDVAFRAISLALPLYVLDEKGTVEFGIFSLGMSLFIFVCGFEAYFILLKQQVQGKSREKALIKSAGRFYCTNWLLFVAPSTLLLRKYGMGWESIAYCLLIYVCEHLYQELYRIGFSTKIDVRKYVIQSVVKSATVTMAFAILIAQVSGDLRCSILLRLWALIDVVFMLGLKPWKWIEQSGYSTNYLGIMIPSCIQFLVGCTGFLGAQIERIGALEILSGESLAVTLRVLALGSIALQIGNLLIYNSSVYRLFQDLKAGEKGKFWKDTLKQITRMALLCLAIGVSVHTLEIIDIGIKKTIEIPPFKFVYLIMGVTLAKTIYDFITIPMRVENKESILVLVGLISIASAFFAMKWLGGAYGILGMLGGCYLYPCLGILLVTALAASKKHSVLY
jgi:hypothetical protein